MIIQVLDRLVDPWLWETGVQGGDSLTVYGRMGQVVCVCPSPTLAEAIVVEHNARVEVVERIGGLRLD